MKSFYLDKNGNSREGNILIFLECSIDNYLQISENKSIIEKLYGEKELWITVNNTEILNSEIDFDKISKLSKQNYKLVIQSIVILCTFLESFINEVGIVELGSKYYKENVDSLSIKSKWEIVLKLVYGKGIDKSKKYYEDFIKLITARNNLVHYKTKGTTEIFEKDLNYFEETFFNSISSLSNFFDDFELLNKEKYVISLIEIKSQLRRKV